MGLGLVATGAVFALYNLTGMISNPLGGIASDRFGEKEVLAVSFTVLCVATYLFARASTTLMIYATVLLIGWFINFVRSPNFAILPKLYGVDNAGSISGVQNTFASLGALVLPLFARARGRATSGSVPGYASPPESSWRGASSGE